MKTLRDDTPDPLELWRCLEDRGALEQGYRDTQEWTEKQVGSEVRWNGAQGVLRGPMDVYVLGKKNRKYHSDICVFIYLGVYICDV